MKKVDPKLAVEIDRIGKIEREINPNMFSALISSIIGQQISTKAAITVENRLLNLVGEISPENIYKAEIEHIQKCGMTTRKAGYIKNIAQLAISKEIDFEKLKELDDQQFIKELVKIKGVGIWTAEMLLIHSLQRKDVLSYSDLAIRRGIEKLYGLEDLSKEEFEVFKKRYSPYGTLAALYLWEISSEPGL